MEQMPKLTSSSTVLNDIVNNDITRFSEAAALAEIDLITSIDELKYIRRFAVTAVNTGRLPYNSVLNAVTMHTDRQIAWLQAHMSYEAFAASFAASDQSANPYSEYCLPVYPEDPFKKQMTPDQERLAKLYALQVAASPFE